jgi:hypothetical protein
MKCLVSLQNYWDDYRFIDIFYSGDQVAVRINDDWRYVLVDIDNVRFYNKEDKEKLYKESLIKDIIL